MKLGIKVWANSEAKSGYVLDLQVYTGTGRRGCDPLYKVRPLIAPNVSICQPAQQLSINEMMIGTRSRVAFLQYIPKKAMKLGIQVWVNSEAKSEYVFDLQVYTGAAIVSNC